MPTPPEAEVRHLETQPTNGRNGAGRETRGHGRSGDSPEPGTLFVIATPIGNLEDLTFRAARVLGEVDALACEDTRRTRTIFERHGLPSPPVIFSYHEHNEQRAARRVLRLLAEGRHVGLCTNAGMPGISDPGYRAISQAAEEGFRVEVIPGPGAVETALVASGLPASSYTFKGFPPRKPGPRRRALEMEREAPHTLVLFESPYRLGKLLADAHEVLGDRIAAVCIELTKKFEEVHRGFLSDLADRFGEARVKGEVTVVIAGNNPKFRRANDDEG
jgi:16S rRNA (cytidine1402-2'-O)-methyltransferase